MILDGTFPYDPRVENEAISLINAGHQVHLFCLTYVKGQPKYEVIDGINIHRVYLPKIFRSLSALTYTFPIYHIRLKKVLDDFFKTYDLNTIHIHDMQVARSVFWALGKRNSIPVVLDLHENRPEIMKFYGHVKSFPGKCLISPKRWKKMEYRYIKKADRVVVVTEEARDYYVAETQCNKDKFIVLPNTTRKSFYSTFTINTEIEQKFADRFNILYVGETGYRRGLHTILDSIPLLKDTIPNIKVVIVGHSKDFPKLKSKIIDLGIEEYVSLEGWKDFKLFPSYIRSSQVCISPIHQNPHHNSTFANKLFQYMAFGRPVIVSDCMPQERIVNTHECGLVFHDRDPKDFSEKLLYLFHHPEKMVEMGENGFKAVKEIYNWEQTSLGLLNYYHEEEKIRI